MKSPFISINLGKSLRRASHFTILELLMAVVVFSLIMLGVMQFLTDSQKLCSKFSTKAEMFENARIALDLIATDIQCAYYEKDHSDKMIFFGFPAPSSAALGGIPAKLAFVTVKSDLPNQHCKSRLAEVQYGLYNNSLYVNITGDYTSSGVANTNWNFLAEAGASLVLADDNTTNSPFKSYDDNMYVTSNPSVNQDGWKEIIPYVVDMQVSCFNRNLSPITSTYGSTKLDKLPYLVKIDLTLIDKANYDKSCAMHTGTFTPGDAIVQNNKFTFSRSIIIDRGQFD